MDRIRKALDLAREKRVQPPNAIAENSPPTVAAEAPPGQSTPVEKAQPVSIAEKPRPTAPALESAVPRLSIVEIEKPPAVVSLVEPHGSLLRNVERLRPVVAAVAKPRPVELTQDAPDSLPSTPQRQSPGDWGPPRATITVSGATASSVAENSRPLVTAGELPRTSAPTLESKETSVPAGQSPGSFSSTVEVPRPMLPIAIEYTKTKTFSPNSEWLQSNRIVDVSGSDAAAGAFRMLRTQVLQRMLEHKWRSIAVLSPGSDDGRTTTAMNLAISLANDQRHTVLLVEFDLKQPIMAKRLGIDAEVGADDVLRGSAGIEDCLYHPDGFDRFVVMPARTPMERSSEMLAGPRCRAIVAELRSRYPDRLLVFDLPPVLGTDDALAFVPLVECALIVVAERSTRRADLLRCMELLRNTPIIGTVLNLSTGAGAAYG